MASCHDEIGGVGRVLLNMLEGVAKTANGGTIKGCGHYAPEEAPNIVVRQLQGFFLRWGRERSSIGLQSTTAGPGYVLAVIGSQVAGGMGTRLFSSEQQPLR